MEPNTNRNQFIVFAFLPILFLIGLLVFNVKLYGNDSLGGSNQMALLLSASLAAILGSVLGIKWEKSFQGILKSISSAMPAMMILLLIGALAGTWMISGIVPSMIYYGLKILNPTIFLVAACIVCAIVSLATGSSWSTVATVGVALLGIGKALGLSDGLIAGAIISGAYFGDKISPLSDTTNLAPAMAGTTLFKHIRYMLFTTVPSITITLIIFLVIGFSSDHNTDMNGINALNQALTAKFYISPLLFIVPILVIVMIVKKVDAVPALFAGSLLGGIAACVFQPDIMAEITGVTDNTIKSSYMGIINSMTQSTAVLTGNNTVDGLLATKGMYGMLNTIWLIICAMCFGGVMEATGFLQVITQSIIGFARTTFSLIATTAGTCIFFNATASDQYLSIVVPGRMFASTFRNRKLKPENLSRTLEDSGTVTSVLFPWNTCGATQAAVLGVATGTYWMYCFFNLISPFMTLVFAFFDIKIAYENDTMDDATENQFIAEQV